MLENNNFDEFEEAIIVEAEEVEEIESTSQADFFSGQLLSIVHRSRRAQSVSVRRKTALAMIDELRDKIIITKGQLLTDDNLDTFILDAVNAVLENNLVGE